MARSPPGRSQRQICAAACYTTAARDEINLEFDQPLVWHKGLESQFYLDGRTGLVATGAASGNVVTLKLNGPAAAEKITYLKERNWSQENLLFGSNGIAALTFCDVLITSPGRKSSNREKATSYRDTPISVPRAAK